MKVLVIGKRHQEGVSRSSGKPYNLNFVAISYPDRDYEGAAVDTIALNADNFPYDSIHIGKQYSLDRNNRGFVIDFSLA